MPLQYNIDVRKYSKNGCFEMSVGGRARELPAVPIIARANLNLSRHNSSIHQAVCKNPHYFQFYTTDIEFCGFPLALTKPSQNLLKHSDPVNTIHCNSPYSTKSPLMQYALMIDGGSTGSRIHIYKSTTAVDHEYEVFEMTQPGLSSFTGKLQETTQSLDVLLDEAVRVVPKFFTSKPPLNCVYDLDHDVQISLGQLSPPYNQVRHPEGYPDLRSSRPRRSLHSDRLQVHIRFE